MIASRSGKVLVGVPLTLLVVLAGAGLAVPVEEEHQGDAPHVAAPHTGHGVALVGQELRLERPVTPEFLPVESAAEIPDSPVVRSVMLLEREIDAKDSRAPPKALPRAPPH